MIRIALHRSSGFIAKAIQWQTRSPYSHASIVMADGSVIESREFRGVRALPRLRLAPGERVDLFSVLGLTESQAEAIEAFAVEQLSKRYDYTMVLRFISRRQESRSASGRWFCSELVYAALKVAGIDLLGRREQPNETQPWEVSPGLLSKSPLLRYEETILPVLNHDSDRLHHDAIPRSGSLAHPSFVFNEAHGY